MLDMKALRENSEEIEARLRSKDPLISLEPLLAQDRELREAIVSCEALRKDKNALSAQIGQKKREGQDVTELLERVGQFGEDLKEFEQKVRHLESQVRAKLLALPNIPCQGSPVSLDPAENVEIKRHLTPVSFSFTPKNHLELGKIHHLFDFERGAKISGSGWAVYQGMGARLEWALVQFMLQKQIAHGFTPYILPHMVREEMMEGVGQLPKFAEQLYKVEDHDKKMYLIPTAEAALNALHYDEILDAQQLPKTYCAYTPCFRREAGALGEKERGLIRIHQFNKVEMFAFTTPEASEEMFDRFLDCAQSVLEDLGLHYRNMLLVTGDMSFCAAKTVDIEVFLPGQERYYEVSSISNCTDYQARRSKIRYKTDATAKPEFVHTLNGSGLATSRLLVSILETFQQPDGSILIPKPLRPYLGGLEVLETSHET